jgi:hypothetical protein
VYLDGTRTETHNIGSGRLISVPAGRLNINRVIQWIENFFADSGTSRQPSVFVNLPPATLERMRVAAWTAPDRLVLHLLNYNVPLGIENQNQVERLTKVQIAMRLPNDLTISSVRLLRPEASSAPEGIPFSVTSAGVISFTISRLHIYEMVLMQ